MPHGFTRLESIVALLVCLMLAWIIVPVGLVKFGIIEADDSTSTAVIGLAAHDKREAAIKPEQVEGKIKVERPRPQGESIVKPKPPELPANQVPPIVSPRSSN